MANTMQGSQSDVADTANSRLDRLSDTAHETVDRFSTAASQAAERLSAKSEELLAAKDELVETTRSYVKEHPIAAVGIALAVGMVLSRILRR